MQDIWLPKVKKQKEFSSEELQKLFPGIGGIKQIEILNITNTGRVKNVKLLGYYGSDQMSGVDIRKRMNLKSNFVRFKFIEDNKIESNNNNSKLLTINKFEDEPLTHIVKAGDSLNDIASKYNVNVYEIIDLNSIKDSSLININQKLLIPRNSSNTSSTAEKILVVSGQGSGHGVGMSQWGARYMALKGQKAESILKHFYKGIRIKPFSKNYL